MSIEGVIFDVSGTMISGSQPAAGVVEAVQRLRALGIQIVAAHNDGPHQRVSQMLGQAGITVDHIVTRNEVGISKGSPRWIDRIKQDTGLQTNQLLYVGDSDQDMITASHSKVIYFHARWSKAQHQYGLPAPGYMAAIIAHIFRKQHPWAWRYDYTTARGTHLRQMALIDGNGAGDDQLKADLIAVLKNSGDPRVGQMLLREFVVLHLIASIYAERLQDETDIWSSYPSRDGRRTSQLTQAIDVAAKLFRDKYRPNLLIRHKPAIHSRNAFQQHGSIADAIDNQLQTIIVNAAHQPQMNGKTILLLDDFLTRGVTAGVGRQLLLAAGATETVVVAIGKYGPRTHLLAPPAGVTWNPIGPAPFAGADCRTMEVNQDFDQVALDEFVASHRAMQTEQW